MNKKKETRKLVLKKETVSRLSDLKKIYGGGCSEITDIPTVTCCCWTASC